MIFFHNMIVLGPETISPFLTLFLIVLLDALAGELGPLFRFWLPHPVVLIGHSISFLERHWNRPELPDQTRQAFGILLLVVISGGACFIGGVLQKITTTSWIGWGIHLIIAMTFLAQRSLYDHVRAVAQAVEKQGIAAGRRAVGMIVGRDISGLDEAGVSRAAIESCAENYSDGVVAPLFWYALGGLPGLLFYKATNTLDSMVGHKTERYLFFGWASARCDDVLNFIPARLSGMLICAVALLWPDWNGQNAIRIMRRDAKTHRSPNAGWPEAAMAGALGLRLGGPRMYHGESAHDPWIGAEGREEATALDIRRATGVLIACGLMVSTLLLAAWGISRMI